jgi:hypothetical protein
LRQEFDGAGRQIDDLDSIVKLDFRRLGVVVRPTQRKVDARKSEFEPRPVKHDTNGARVANVVSHWIVGAFLQRPEIHPSLQKQKFKLFKNVRAKKLFWYGPTKFAKTTISLKTTFGF